MVGEVCIGPAAIWIYDPFLRRYWLLSSTSSVTKREETVAAVERRVSCHTDVSKGQFLVKAATLMIASFETGLRVTMVSTSARREARREGEE